MFSAPHRKSETRSSCAMLLKLSNSSLVVYRYSGGRFGLTVPPDGDGRAVLVPACTTD